MNKRLVGLLMAIAAMLVGVMVFIEGGPVGAAAQGPMPGASPTITPSASDYSAQGLAFLDQGDYEQAIVSFSEAIRLDPTNMDAYYQRGLAYINLGQFSQAIADYDVVISHVPDNSYACYNRGYA